MIHQLSSEEGKSFGSAAEDRFCEMVRKEMRLRDYRLKSIKSYVSCLRSLYRFFASRDLQQLNEGDLRTYMLHLYETKRLASSTVSQAHNALRFLYVEVYRRPVIMKRYRDRDDQNGFR